MGSGIVQCTCCGKGVLEIKCPYNARECTISDAVHENLIDYLEKTPCGFSLKHSHSDYYQIQTQLFICEATYADLVVWTTKDCFIERIISEYDFFIEIVYVMHLSALPEISDAHDVFLTPSLQTSVNFPRTRPLKCMEQSAFLFNLNQERIEMSEAHHKLCFIDEIKDFMVYLWVPWP